MGWTNYLVVDDLKLAVEISRYVYDIEDYEKESLDYLIEEKDINDIEDTMFTCLTIKELAELAMTHSRVSNLNGIDQDKFLIYWLLSRKKGYEIVSEHDVNIEELKGQGYTILRLYEDNPITNTGQNEDRENEQNEQDRQDEYLDLLPDL